MAAAHPEGVLYVGSSKEEMPDEDPALKWAILNAYNKGMAAKSEEERILPDGSAKRFRFRVVDIFVEGTNPPTDYKAHLADA